MMLLCDVCPWEGDEAVDTEAVVLIVSLGFRGYDVAAYCERHAPEEVHEARSSMGEDEFTIVTLNTAEVGS